MYHSRAQSVGCSWDVRGRETPCRSVRSMEAEVGGGSNESKEDALGRAVGGGRRTKRRKVGGGGVEGQSAFRLTL